MECKDTKDNNRICMVCKPIERYFFHEFSFEEKSVYELGNWFPRRSCGYRRQIGVKHIENALVFELRAIIPLSISVRYNMAETVVRLVVLIHAQCIYE